MKKRERIMGIKEQSNERIVREKMWYFSEETANSFSPVQEDEDLKKPEDRYSKIIRERKDHLVPKAFMEKKPKRECSFVVDWQLSDSF